eukprot:TRINITY_DN4115_c0_g1_i5.p1 TRINITY_DN4115_c0_g1~~TRINITY_DN4115_c0_g1_i5.p1  ORF type:complete len:173 (+),score=14.00 TRINITY_DN4115_c0_g1_i5:87-605(+)
MCIRDRYYNACVMEYIIVIMCYLHDISQTISQRIIEKIFMTDYKNYCFKCLLQFIGGTSNIEIEVKFSEPLERRRLDYDTYHKFLPDSMSSALIPILHDLIAEDSKSKQTAAASTREEADYDKFLLGTIVILKVALAHPVGCSQQAGAQLLHLRRHGPPEDCHQHSARTRSL